MKFDDLKNKTPDELKKTLLGMKKEQMELRFQLSAGQLENPAKLRHIRRDVARVHTAMNAPEGTKSEPKTKTETKAKPAAAKKKPAAKTKAA